jgi:RecA/RadA recombinase
MAKKKKEPTSNYDLDEAFEAATEQARELFPSRIYTGSEESMRAICLPMPALAPRVLFQQEGYPLGRFILLSGPKESCKSACGYEFLRWHRLQKGRGIIIEVEDKRSPELCQSIMNYDPKAIQIHRCTTMEEWNSALTHWLDTVKMLMDGDPNAPKARPGRGRMAPFGFMVDSIMSAVTEGVMHDIEKEGHTGKRYALEAGQLSDYMKAFTKWLSDYPFSVIGINHVKPGQDRYGNPVHNMPGGKAPGYHASLHVEMTRVGKQWRMADGTEGLHLKMDVLKNSSAPHANIEVDMVWKMDVDNITASGECLQRTYFDWETASIEILNKWLEDSGRDIKRKLSDLVDLHCNKTTQKVWSTQLGISDDSPVSYREGGLILEEKIQSDKSFRDNLYPLLGIRRRPLYRPGPDYREQMQEARQAALDAQKDREAIVLSSVVNSPAVEISPEDLTDTDDFDFDDDKPKTTLEVG